MVLQNALEIWVVLLPFSLFVLVQSHKKEYSARDHGDELPVMAERNKDFDWSAYQMFLNGVTGGTRENEYDGPPQQLLLIGAGLPRTGTASFQKAMELLGFNCYHMIEAAKTKGHLGLWHEHLVQKSIPFGNILESLATHGFNATVDMPAAYKYKEQMQIYPDAKVILTLRSEEDSEQAAQKWAKSMTSTILQFPTRAREIPYCWIPPIVRVTEFLGASYDGVNLPFRAEQHHELPDYYTAWNEEVQRVVPPENLLIFRAKDGWEPLCEFLSPLHEVVHHNCQALLDANEPYPHVNDTEKVKSIITIFANITSVCKALPGVLLLLALILAIIRRSKSSASREKVE